MDPLPPDGSADPAPEPAPDPGASADAVTIGRIAAARQRAEEYRHKAEERLAQERAQRGWVRLAIRAWERDRDRGGGLLAGGIAYRFFLWQLPTALVLVSVASVVASLTEVDPSAVASNAGLTAAVAATLSSAATGAETARWWLLVLGLWGMAWAGRGAVRSVRLVSSLAWQVPVQPLRGSKPVLAFNGLMLGVMFLQFGAQELAEASLVAHAAIWIVMTLVTLGMSVLVFVLLPRREGSWTQVLPGAIFFTLGLRGIRLAMTVYFASRMDRIQDVYGSIGIAVVILLVLYLTARVFLWGLYLSATFAGVDSHGETFALEFPAGRTKPPED